MINEKNTKNVKKQEIYVITPWQSETSWSDLLKVAKNLLSPEEKQTLRTRLYLVTKRV